MRRFWATTAAGIVWAGLCGCGGGHASKGEPATPSTTGGEAVSETNTGGADLCVDLAAIKQADKVDLNDLLGDSDVASPEGTDWIPAVQEALGEGNQLVAAYTLDDAMLVVASLCKGKADCGFVIARFQGEGAAPTAVGEPRWFPYGTGLPGVIASIQDTDGDGNGELWVFAQGFLADVSSAGEGKPGAVRVKLWALSLPDLEPTLEIELSKEPAGGDGDKCQTELYRTDLTCDGRPDLLAHEICARPACFPRRFGLDVDYSVRRSPEEECAELTDMDRSDCFARLRMEADARAMDGESEGAPSAGSSCREEKVTTKRYALIWDNGAYRAAD